MDRAHLSGGTASRRRIFAVAILVGIHHHFGSEFSSLGVLRALHYFLLPSGLSAAAVSDVNSLTSPMTSVRWPTDLTRANSMNGP